MAGLYVHVPFCVRKCRYCDFYSVETGGGARAGRAHPLTPSPTDYLAALERELTLLPEGFSPTTLFLGGGTPTELATEELESLLAILASRVDLAEVEEWTCEANPGTLTPDKIDCLREAGVNRLSIGVQSFDAGILQFLGRIHSVDEAVESVQQARKAGFENVSIDLMYGVPGQTAEQWQHDLERAVALKPEHISCYCLAFEEGTPLDALRRRGLVKETEDQSALEQYTLARHMLSQAGYLHYELSNFAKPGFECRHNLLYWSGGEYIGAGPSAHSHWNGERYANVANLSEYVGRLMSGTSPIAFRERLTPEAKARETLVMALRRLDGVDAEWFVSVTGYDYRALCEEVIERLSRDGLLEYSDNRLRLTERALFISNAVLSELV